eukprot:2757146-Pyramimonas_sp.AAC.1
MHGVAHRHMAQQAQRTNLRCDTAATRECTVCMAQVQRSSAQCGTHRRTAHKSVVRHMRGAQFCSVAQVQCANAQCGTGAAHKCTVRHE